MPLTCSLGCEDFEIKVIEGRLVLAELSPSFVKGLGSVDPKTRDLLATDICEVEVVGIHIDFLLLIIPYRGFS